MEPQARLSDLLRIGAEPAYQTQEAPETAYRMRGADGRNQTWSMDFMADQLADG